MWFFKNLDRINPPPIKTKVKAKTVSEWVSDKHVHRGDSLLKTGSQENDKKVCSLHIVFKFFKDDIWLTEWVSNWKHIKREHI